MCGSNLIVLTNGSKELVLLGMALKAHSTFSLSPRRSIYEWNTQLRLLVWRSPNRIALEQLGLKRTPLAPVTWERSMKPLKDVGFAHWIPTQNGY